MNLVGTRWRRNDGILIEIVADAEAASGRTNRSVRARNLDLNREFWVTPEGLTRKYKRLPDGSFTP